MMGPTAQLLSTTRYRLAQHYLDRLRTAGATFRRGHENSTYGLALFEREWAQIKHWQAWLADRLADDPAAAPLCAEYPHVGADLLAVRQSTQERIAWLEIGLKAAQQQGDLKRAAVQLYHLADAQHEGGAFKRAEDYAAQALGLARSTGDQLYVGRSLSLLGEINRLLGNYSASQTFFEESLAVFRQLDRCEAIGAAYQGLGLIAWHQADSRRAREHLAQHLDVALEFGQEADICEALIDLSLPVWDLEGQAAALPYIVQCVERARAIGYHRALASGLNTLGQMKEEQGELTEALSCFEEAIAISRSTGIKLNLSAYLKNLGYVRHLLGDQLGAVQDLEESVALARAHGERRGLAYGLLHLVLVYDALGDTDHARPCLQEGLKIARELEDALIKVHLLIAAVNFWQTLGADEQAAECLGPLLKFPNLPQEEQTDLQKYAAQLTARLGYERFTAAAERGAMLTLDEVVDQVASMPIRSDLA